MIWGNVKLFLSHKSQIYLVEDKENKNEYRTRASLFQSSEDGKQEFFYVALEKYKGESKFSGNMENSFLKGPSVHIFD